MQTYIVEILLVFQTLLISIVGFFVRNMIIKFDNQSSVIVAIKTDLALLGKDYDGYKRELSHLYVIVTEAKNDIKNIESRIIKMGNELNTTVLKCNMRHNED